ncbi:hypothetical protein [Microbacterium album]|uniref:Uncharacterized protein n=1 Tax=Microbacterium album TaxID=2053191 RepID=A0A917IFE5_9MICO|nr:hypothetical protein [Microbacterium album]GGH47849.1 hypothetical protein GCM10010921_24890 [Microbacterium album]
MPDTTIVRQSIRDAAGARFRRRLRRGLLGAAAAGIATAMLLATPATALVPDLPGPTIQVEVVQTSGGGGAGGGGGGGQDPAGGGGAPAPAGPAQTPSGSGTWPAGGGTSDPAPGAQTPQDDSPEPAAADGTFYVGALQSEVRPSLWWDGGEVTVRLPVRNLSPERFDGRVEFVLTTFFGMEIGRQSVAVRQLEPGIAEEARASFASPGPWTFYSASATFVPPEKIGDAATEEVAREAFVLVPPIALLVTLGLIVAAVFGFRFLRERAVAATPVPGAAA